MKKKLPNLYVNRIEKRLNNNDTVFYSFLAPKYEEKEIKEAIPPYGSNDIRERIKDLFNSPNYVYKMHAQVILKDRKVLDKDIIGQMGGKLITIDEDLIDIDDIQDIKF